MQNYNRKKKSYREFLISFILSYRWNVAQKTFGPYTAVTPNKIDRLKSILVSNLPVKNAKTHDRL